MQTNHTTDDLRIKITANDRGNPPGKLADVELHFSGESPLAGLKRAHKILQESNKPKKVLHFVSDFRESKWDSGDAQCWR